MKQFVSGCLVFLFITAPLFSQTPDEDIFNDAFLRIYMQTASKDVGLALEQADSLYQTAGTPVHRVRSLMLIGDMHHRVANRDSTIHYALLADRIAKKENLYDWQVRIYGVLATQYREIGLLNEGKKYVEMGMVAIEKVEDDARAALSRAQYHQELGYYALEENELGKAIGYFKQASTFFDGLPESVSRNFALMQNDERLGLCYLELGMVDLAKIHYQQALETMRQTAEEETPLAGFIYSGLGRVYLAEGLYHEADSCLTAALDIAEKSGFPQLQINVYQSLARYHEQLGNVEQQLHYKGLHAEASKQYMAKHKKYADNIFTDLQQKMANMTVSNKVMSLMATISLLLFGIGAPVYIWRQRRNNRRFRGIITQLKQNQKEESPTTKCIKDKDLMPDSTKQDLLRKLERFESSQQFLDKGISIAVLAGKMKTNTKYLSYIINQYRNKDFNSYINELRINYIMDKLNRDSRYLNYKISYLAQECGFATHSQFTTVFRNLTGLSPSSFMVRLKREQQKDEKELVD